MIHDAKVEVTCDHRQCDASEIVDLSYVYHDLSGKSGHYDSDDSEIEKTLVEDHDWNVLNGKHYCCNDCLPEEDDS